MPEISVEVRRHDHRYSVCIGPYIETGLAAEIETRLGAGDHIVIADARAAGPHRLAEAFESRPGWRYRAFEAGEARKTARDFVALCESILSLGIDRKTVIVAIGGGVTGDMAGFAAATLLRGLRLVQVPTTLLAQVDSSVGGKVGVNLAGGKNLLGAFHQPDLVVADPAFLATLPGREYLAGLAEAVKYGILGDGDFFSRLLEAADPIAGRDAGVMADIVGRCCRMKAGIVGMDEKESERRQLLNLGHTFGHAIEALAGYDGSVLHGEAVSVGIAMAAAFAGERGHLSPGDAGRIEEGLRRLNLPCRLEDLAAGDARREASIAGVRRRLASGDLAAALAKDKKKSAGGLTLVLPYAVGDCRIVRNVPPDQTVEFIRRFCRVGN